MKLCFVSENGVRETYFVDAPRNIPEDGILHSHCTLSQLAIPEASFSSKRRHSSLLLDQLQMPTLLSCLRIADLQH
jgi:hypothetical protein